MYKSLLRFILDSQNEDGSFGRDTLQGGNVLTTAQVLSLIQSDKTPGQYSRYVEGAVRYLQSQQQASGKWTEMKPRPRELSMTASALLALSQAGVSKSDAGMNWGVSWLLGKQKETGEFVESDVVMRVTLYSQSLTLGALAQFGKDYIEASSKGIQALHEAQNEDGGFGMRAGDISHPTVTGYVISNIHAYRAEFASLDSLVVLQSTLGGAIGAIANSKYVPLARVAGKYLAKTQSDIGEWESWVVDDFQIEGIAAGLAAYRLVGEDMAILDRASRLLMHRLGNLSWVHIPMWQLVLSAAALRDSPDQ